MNSNDQVTEHYFVEESGMTLNAPAKCIWPVLLDFKRFNTTIESVELLSGEENQLGAVSKIVKKEGEWYADPYLIKIAHIELEKQIVWHAFPMQGDAYSLFAEYSLQPQGEMTRFIHRVYSHMRSPKMSSDALSRTQTILRTGSNRLEKEIVFPNLKQLVEKDVGEINV